MGGQNSSEVYGCVKKKKKTKEKKKNTSITIQG